MVAVETLETDEEEVEVEEVELEGVEGLEEEDKGAINLPRVPLHPIMSKKLFESMKTMPHGTWMNIVWVLTTMTKVTKMSSLPMADELLPLNYLRHYPRKHLAMINIASTGETLLLGPMIRLLRSIDFVITFLFNWFFIWPKASLTFYWHAQIEFKGPTSR